MAEPFSAAPGLARTFRGALALFDPATVAFLRDLTAAHADGAPVFSHDGRQVAFTRGEDLYVVAISGARKPRLLRHGVRDPTWGAR